MTRSQLERLIDIDSRLSRLFALRDQGRFPFYRVLDAVGPEASVEGRQCLILGANNYLGLATHPLVREAAVDAIARFGTSTTGSRTLNGTVDLHLELEAEIASWYDAEDALVCTTGYQTNLGVLDAVVKPGQDVVLDQYAHASLVDGCRLTGANPVRFRHNDVQHLEQVLDDLSGDRPPLVIVDGLYSMEGDLAPLNSIAALCAERNAVLMVDEAHSVGVLGGARRGVSELCGVIPNVDIMMGSLSKALGSAGGFIAGCHSLIDAMRVKAGAFMFTTSAVPAAVGAALAAVRIVRSDEGHDLAEQLQRNASILREGLLNAGLPVGAHSVLPCGDALDTAIIPVYVGEDFEAVSIWNKLLERGVYVSVALHPAVPKAGALLRLCVMATHTEAQIEYAVDQLVACVPRANALMTSAVEG